MTDQQKREFLEREGWKWDDALWVWWDPVDLDDIERVLIDDFAYRIASKRKAARERARLRKAGAEYDGYVNQWFLDPNKYGMTRQEAIAYLDRMEGKE